MRFDDDNLMQQLRIKYFALLEDLKLIKAKMEKIKAGETDAVRLAPGERSTPKPRRSGDVYRLRHPQPGYSGFFAGVDFSNGLGSTSNYNDYENAVDRWGCIDVTDARAAQAKAESTLRGQDINS